jgi:hypothetical protein
MRISKLPIPLLIAAAAITGVAVIYVYLTAPPMPIHTDPNFTTPLFAGGVYTWRGAAFQYILSADGTISVAYGPGYHLIYTTGPLSNISVAADKWIVYPLGERRLYVERRTFVRAYDAVGEYACPCTFYLVYRLEDITPPNSSIPSLNVWLPRTFGTSEYLTTRESDAIRTVLGIGLTHYRVLSVATNGTHLIYRLGARNYDFQLTAIATMSSPVTGTTIRVTNTPTSTTYTIGDNVYTATLLPYLFFGIVPSGTVNVVIYVN